MAGRTRRIARNLTSDGPIFGIYDKESPEVAEFRRLLFRLRNIKSPNSKDIGTSYLITSAARDEGKTIVASYLAITAAEADPRPTLLIDADLRRPKVHEFFGLKREGGLSELLYGMGKLEADLHGKETQRAALLAKVFSDEVSLGSYLKDTAVENLKVLTSGRPFHRPSELIRYQRLGVLLSIFRRKFTNIIIDSPPVIPVSDTVIMGPEVDATILVVMAGKTPREVVMRAKDILTSAKVNLVGVVANDLKGALPYYYSYKYYKYYYREREK